MTGFQKARDDDIIQELSDIGAGQGQIQHIFPVTGFNGLQIAFQGLHFLFHPACIFRRHTFGFPRFFRATELIFWRSQNQGFNIARRVIVSGHHEFGDFNLSHGDDNAAGTQTAPFQTLAKAQAVVRALQPIAAPITAWVRGGTYYLTSPLVFAPADSGSAKAPITCAAFANESMTLSGGVKLNPTWSAYSGNSNIMVAAIGTNHVSQQQSITSPARPCETVRRANRPCCINSAARFHPTRNERRPAFRFRRRKLPPCRRQFLRRQEQIFRPRRQL